MVVEYLLEKLGPLAPVGVLFIRNLYGWGVNALKDKKVQPYEWILLGKTVLSLGGLALLLHLGTHLDGVDSAAIVASIDAGRNDVLEPLFKILGKK